MENAGEFPAAQAAGWLSPEDAKDLRLELETVKKARLVGANKLLAKIAEVAALRAQGDELRELVSLALSVGPEDTDELILGYSWVRAARAALESAPKAREP